MIELKKAVSQLYLKKTTVTIQDTELNAHVTSDAFDFTGTPVLFISIQNDSNVDFTTLHLIDGNDAVITHNAPLNANTYSIAFSGKNSGQPLTSTELFNLNSVRVEWVFTGLAVGSITIKIYTFAI